MVRWALPNSPMLPSLLTLLWQPFHLQTHQPAASESCVATVCFYGTYCGHRWVEIDCCGGLDGPLSSAKWSNVAIIADSSLKAISPSNTPTSRMWESGCHRGLDDTHFYTVLCCWLMHGHAEFHVVAWRSVYWEDDDVTSASKKFNSVRILPCLASRRSDFKHFAQTVWVLFRFFSPHVGRKKLS